jgi:RNA polymerase sigma factor (sigma-70 family)
MPDPLFTVRCLRIARDLARERQWGKSAAALATLVWALMPCLGQLQNPTDADIATLLGKCYEHVDGPVVLDMLSEGSIEGARHWEAWSRYVYGIAAGGDRLPPQVAEDLSQVVCAALFKSLPSFRFDSSLRSFVFRVYLNCKYQWLRTKETRYQMEAQPLSTGDDEESELPLPMCTPGPEESYDAAERKALVEEAIRGVKNAQDAKILKLSYLQDDSIPPDTGEKWSDPAIGKLLDMTAKNVSVRRFRALKRLRGCPRLKEAWDALPGQEIPGTVQSERIAKSGATNRARETETPTEHDAKPKGAGSPKRTRRCTGKGRGSPRKPADDAMEAK